MVESVCAMMPQEHAEEAAPILDESFPVRFTDEIAGLHCAAIGLFFGDKVLLRPANCIANRLVALRASAVDKRTK